LFCEAKSESNDEERIWPPCFAKQNPNPMMRRGFSLLVLRIFRLYPIRENLKRRKFKDRRIIKRKMGKSTKKQSFT